MVKISSKLGIAIVTILMLIFVACGGSSDETTETISTLTPTPTVFPTVTPTSIPTDTSTLEPISTPTEAVTSTQTPISEVTPVSTPTPVPTASPTPISVPTPVSNEKTTPTTTGTPNPDSQLMFCSFNGYVSLDDASVPDDTVITAWIDGHLVGSAATKGSAYTMAVTGEFTGKVVNFKIDSYKASQTAIWENGTDITVGLSVHLGPPVCDFYGTVTQSGGLVPDGTPISAWMDGAVVGTTTVSGSEYRLQVTGVYSGKTVSFKVGPDLAMETSTWERGGNENVDLTVVVP